MAMSYIWTAIVLISVLGGYVLGNGSAVASAALEGAAAAVKLSISMAGVLCLWYGGLEIMHQAGLLDKLTKLLRPILKLLYPAFAKDNGVMEPLSANVSANLLGLGNAATPMGIQAACRMNKGGGNVASDAMCMLVVCNTASIQLIPATVAGVRAAEGCASPFDIIPAVWMASIFSVLVGIAAVLICRRIWRS